MVCSTPRKDRTVGKCWKDVQEFQYHLCHPGNTFWHLFGGYNHSHGCMFFLGRQMAIDEILNYINWRKMINYNNGYYYLLFRLFIISVSLQWLVNADILILASDFVWGLSRSDTAPPLTDLTVAGMIYKWYQIPYHTIDIW